MRKNYQMYLPFIYEYVRYAMGLKIGNAVEHEKLTATMWWFFFFFFSPKGSPFIYFSSKIINTNNLGFPLIRY